MSTSEICPLLTQGVQEMTTSKMSIPSWLETPPNSKINPPTVSKLQELPFDEMSWEDFEKLCLRLVRLESDVEHCQLYGIRGQEQRGSLGT